MELGLSLQYCIKVGFTLHIVPEITGDNACCLAVVRISNCPEHGISLLCLPYAVVYDRGFLSYRVRLQLFRGFVIVLISEVHPYPLNYNPVNYVRVYWSSVFYLDCFL